VPKRQPKPKAQSQAQRPNLAELDFEDDEATGLGILDDDGNMVLRRGAAKPAKGAKRAKDKARKPAR
jgi:hypothetical protein